jgi:hypothetical protein
MLNSSDTRHRAGQGPHPGALRSTAGFDVTHYQGINQ